jgi:hypothetical protein
MHVQVGNIVLKSTAMVLRFHCSIQDLGTTDKFLLEGIGDGLLQIPEENLDGNVLIMMDMDYKLPLKIHMPEKRFKNIWNF